MLMSWRPRRRLVLVGVGGLTILLAAVAVGRSRGPEKACTLIGSGHGISVQIAPERPKVTRAVACVRGRCQKLGYSIDGVRKPGGEVGIPDRDAGPGTVDVVLVLERRTGRAKVRTTRVKLAPYEPNGPGCGTYWRGAVAFRDDRLQQVPE